MSLLPKVLSGYAWVSVGFMAKALAQFVALVVLSRVLDKAVYGEISLIFVLYNLLWTCCEVAVGYTVMRIPTARPKYLHGMFTISVMAGFLICGAIIGGNHIISDVYQAPDLFWPGLVVAGAVLIRSFSVVAEYLLTKEMRFGLLSRIEIGGHVAFVVMLLVVVMLGFPYWAWPMALVAYLLFKTACCLVARPHSKMLMWDRRVFKQIGYFIGGYVGTSFLSTAASEGDKLIVGKILGLAALGVYGRAMQLFMLPASILGQALDKVLTAALAVDRRDLDRSTRAMYASTALIAMLMIPGGLAVYLLAPEIVLVVLGDNWLDVVPLLQILSLTMYFRVAIKSAESLLRAQGMVYRRMKAYAIFDVVLLCALVIASQRGGLDGAVFAVMGGNVFFYIVLMWPVVRFLNLSVLRLTALHMRGVIFAGLLWGASMVILPYLRVAIAWPFMVLVAYGMLAGTGFVLLCALVGPRRVLGAEGYLVYDQIKSRLIPKPL